MVTENSLKARPKTDVRQLGKFKCRVMTKKYFWKKKLLGVDRKVVYLI